MTGLVSGFWMVLHLGHIQLFKESKNLCDKLICVVNNDLQTEHKYDYILIPAVQRIEVLKSIKYIDKVFLSIDEDESVAQSIIECRPDVFFNGGDRTGPQNPKEVTACESIDCRIVTLSSVKQNSSSEIIKKIVEEDRKKNRR